MECQRPCDLGQLGLQPLRDFRLQRTSSWRSYCLRRRNSFLRQGERQVKETNDRILRLNSEFLSDNLKGLSLSPSRQTLLSLHHIQQSFRSLFPSLVPSCCREDGKRLQRSSSLVYSPFSLFDFFLLRLSLSLSSSPTQNPPLHSHLVALIRDTPRSSPSLSLFDYTLLTLL